MKPKVTPTFSRFLISMVVIFGILIGQPLYATELDIAGFKCKFAPVAGNKLAIFVLTSDADGGIVTNRPSQTGNSHPQPQDGKIFCVDIPNEKQGATWDELKTGARNSGYTDLLKTDWYNDDVVEQLYIDTVDDLTYPIRSWFQIAYDVLVDDPDPGETVYILRQEVEVHRDDFDISSWDSTFKLAFPTSINLRLRYEFNDLSPDSPTNLYLYFMKIADPVQYSGATAECALHNGNLDLCEKDTVNKCVFAGSDSKCYAGNDARICGKFSLDKECNTTTACQWKESKCQAKDSATVSNEAVKQFIFKGYGEPKGYSGPLVTCAFDGSCRSIEQLVEQAVKIADWLFSIIAGLAFMFFVYGGITMIMSFGNSEKVGKGKQILVAAAVGLIITFSAYILISFVVKAIGINAGLTPFN